MIAFRVFLFVFFLIFSSFPLYTSSSNNNIIYGYDYYNSGTMYSVWDLSNNSTNLLPEETTEKLSPTEIFLRETSFSLNSIYSYNRFALQGSGSLWKENSGIAGIWIDLRENSPLIQDSSTMKSAGILYDSLTGNLQYSIIYTNQHSEPDIIHAHGQEIDYKLDGTPFLSDLPLQPGESKQYNYELNLNRHNGGTFFIHSHFSFGHIKRMSSPFIIQQTVPNNYPKNLAAKINSAQDVVMFLEDFCLAFTDEDDQGNDAESNSDDTNQNRFREAKRCENPFIVYRQVFAEWNHIKRPQFLGPDQDINLCQDPVIAPEFGPQFVLANDRTVDQPQRIAVQKDSFVRLRIINSASMVNFRIDVGEKLYGEVRVIAVDGHLIEPVKMNSVWLGVAQRIDLLIEMEEEGEYPILAITEAPTTSKSQIAAIILVVESEETVNIPNNCTTEEKIPETIQGIGMLSLNKSIIIEQEKLFKSFPANPFGLLQNAKIFQVNLTGYNGILGFNKKSYQLPPSIPYSQWQLQPTHPDSIKIHSGDSICLNFTNFNWDTHPIHLHGHHFIVREMNGELIENSALRDTVLIPAGDCNTTQICFVADNPYKGIHGLHCHMAIHEMAGMFLTIEYEDYQPPQYSFPTTDAELQCNNNENETRKALQIGLGVGLSLGILLILLLGFLCKNTIQAKLLNGKNKSTAPFEAISLQPGNSSLSKPTHHDEDME